VQAGVTRWQNKAAGIEKQEFESVFRWYKFVALPSTHSDNKFISQQDVEKRKKRKYVTVAELYFSNTLEL